MFYNKYLVDIEGTDFESRKARLQLPVPHSPEICERLDHYDFKTVRAYLDLVFSGKRLAGF